jgi:uncharacterized protein YdhG (YjbR/CyaY superfamily)
VTVDEYLDAAPEPHRSTLRGLRQTLRHLLPEATEQLSYGMPAFKLGGKAIAGYAHFKAHCSYFPHSGTVLPELADQLEGYDWTKGTLKFAVDQPLPEQLVQAMVDVRLEQLGMTR